MKDISKLKLLFSEEEIQKKIAEIANTINKDFEGEELCIICVLKGATPFCMDLIKKINLPMTLEFVRISTYESRNSSGKVSNLDMTLPSLDNKNVLIIEDIVDTGFTADFLIKTINLKNKVKSLKLVSLLNKSSARKIEVNVDYYCFDIDNKFIIGYGLDYDDYCRNIPYIGYLE